MVICELQGGLGNQMFQYASAYALAARLKTSLKLEISYYQPDRHRIYELGTLSVTAPVLTYPKDIFLWPWCKYRVCNFLKNRKLLNLPSGFSILKDDWEKGFDDRILSATGDILLQGYWQSERYFLPIETTLREEFAFRVPPNPPNVEMMQRIEGCNAVALHVRRGDYVSSAPVAAYHGLCGLDYYRQAIEEMRRYVSDMHFFVFSDDPEWTRNNLEMPGSVTYVTHNVGRNNSEDLRLMTHCKHYIIANSSFSWWGAWLSRHAKKQVIAPRKWIAHPPHSIPGLIPDGWILK